MHRGYIKAYRRLIEWEWFTDVNTCHLFFYCLLKANHKTNKWRGHTIPRGSFITSYESLSKETGLSIQNVRTALNKLKLTNELTSQSTNQNTLITINNYEMYQDDNIQINKRLTNEQQTTNKRLTTNNNDNNDNNEKNIYLLAEKQKMLDPYVANHIIDEFVKEYTKLFGCRCYLTAQQKTKIMELNADIQNFKNTIPEAIRKLKNVNFDLPNFKPTANWLLKDNNYTAILNGAYDKKLSAIDEYFANKGGN